MCRDVLLGQARRHQYICEYMKENDLARQEIGKRKKRRRKIETIATENVARTRTMQLPSGCVLETTTRLIDAIIMTGEKKEETEAEEQREETPSSLSRCYSPETTDHICVLLWHTRINTHTHTHRNDSTMLLRRPPATANSYLYLSLHSSQMTIYP